MDICAASNVSAINDSTIKLLSMSTGAHVKMFFWGVYLGVGEGKGTPLQYSCLENPMDGGAWWAAVHGVAKSRTRLSDFTFTFHFHALEKAMATHSSVLAWRIPGTGEPRGLPSVGSHRVGHDWSDAAAAAYLGVDLLVHFMYDIWMFRAVDSYHHFVFPDFFILVVQWIWLVTNKCNTFSHVCSSLKLPLLQSAIQVFCLFSYQWSF